MEVREITMAQRLRFVRRHRGVQDTLRSLNHKWLHIVTA
nr:MAG TPA: hypothetical protein [Caudoviricetes sp.]